MSKNYWSDLPEADQAELRKIGLRFRELVPGVGDDGTVPDSETAAALLEIINIQNDLSDEYVYWLELSNDVLEAFADWQSRTKARFERRGIPWTVGELARRAHLWEHE